MLSQRCFFIQNALIIRDVLNLVVDYHQRLYRRGISNSNENVDKDLNTRKKIKTSNQEGNKIYI